MIAGQASEIVGVPGTAVGADTCNEIPRLAGVTPDDDIVGLRPPRPAVLDAPVRIPAKRVEPDMPVVLRGDGRDPEQEELLLHSVTPKQEWTPSANRPML